MWQGKTVGASSLAWAREPSQTREARHTMRSLARRETYGKGETRRFRRTIEAAKECLLDVSTCEAQMQSRLTLTRTIGGGGTTTTMMMVEKRDVVAGAPRAQSLSGERCEVWLRGTNRMNDRPAAFRGRLAATVGVAWQRRRTPLGSTLASKRGPR